MPHVLTRFTGFGLVVTPVDPYRVELVVDDPAALALSTTDEEDVRSVVVRGGREAPVADLGPNVQALAEVVGGVQRGPDTDEWLIETSVYTIGWPAGFVVASPVDASESAFDLQGPDGALIWLQGPFQQGQLPAVEELAAPGQTLVGMQSAGGIDAVELAYQYQGEDWNQRHYLVPFGEVELFVVTAQAPAHQLELLRLASAEVAASLRPQLL